MIKRTEIELRSKANLSKTKIVVFFSFIITTVINFILLGVLSRIGGLELVGKWVMMNAMIMIVLIFDFGFTNAFSYRISREGVSSVQSAIRTLVLIVLAIATLSVALYLYSVWSLGTGDIFIVAVFAAGLMQLVTSWLCSIKMGMHQQYWFNIVSLIRVIVQSGFAILFLINIDVDSNTSMGAALAIGAFFGLLAALALVRKHISITGQAITLRKLAYFNKGFGVESISQRALQPISQLMVGQMLGATSLGILSISQRIPSVINMCISESLKSLLPGIAGVYKVGHTSAVTRTLHSALLFQLVLIIPTTLFFYIHADLVINVWIGISDSDLTRSLRLLLLVMIAMSVCAPFYWSLHGLGDSKILERIGVIRLGFILVFGLSVILITSNLFYFISVYAIGQAGYSLACIYIANMKYEFVLKAFQQVNLARLILFAASFMLLNSSLASLTWAEVDFKTLLFFIILNGILFSGLSYAVLSLGWLSKSSRA